jgi:hypothetical protein
MHAPIAVPSSNSDEIANGAGAAAILAAGVGAFLVGVFDVAADKSPAIKSLMIFWKPTGALSGVTTTAVVIWLVVWAILRARWRNRTVRLASVKAAALVLLALGLLLTFPPLADLL